MASTVEEVAGCGYLGESLNYQVWLIYRPDLEFLKSAESALTLAKADGTDESLIEDFLTMLHRERLDFTQAFRALYTLASRQIETAPFFSHVPEFAAWRQRWETSRPKFSDALLEAMRLANPCYIPRNHQVEAALEAAVDSGDLSPLKNLLAVVEQPFNESPAYSAYGNPAPQEFTAGYQTFCGT